MLVREQIPQAVEDGVASGVVGRVGEVGVGRAGTDRADEADSVGGDAGRVPCSPPGAVAAGKRNRGVGSSPRCLGVAAGRRGEVVPEVGACFVVVYKGAAAQRESFRLTCFCCP